MASLVDVIGVFKTIGLYDTVFPGILIFALVYGMLYKYKPFGENKMINSAVALVVALLFISFIKAVTFISFLIPIITALFVILLLVLLIFTFMGIPSESIGEAMKSSSGYGVMIILIVIFVFIALSASFPELQNGGAAEEGSLESYTQVIFNPVILGMIVLITIMAVATYYVTREKTGTT